MEGRDISGCNFDGGFNTLICQEDLNVEEHHPDQDKQQVSMSNMIPSKHYKLVAVSLALLAAVFLMIDIGLGVHYNKLTDNHLTLDDTELISSELLKLQDSYKTAIETTKSAKKQLDSEISRQKPTNWEFEHQKKRTEEYEGQLEKTKKDIDAMAHYLPMINGGCKHCPPGWILRNSICYYFAFPEDGLKSWQNARDYCKVYGGDLAIIDSIDKENFTVNHMLNKPRLNINGRNGFWIGLRDVHEEGTWKWLDGKLMVEGYWIDGEPNDDHDEDCASVLPKENFFQAWNDAPCDALKLKWICEKALTNISS